MNCRGVYRRLSAYIDSDLSPGIKQGVEEHLQNCPSCKRRLTEFDAIVNAAHKLTSLAVSEGFEERVLSAIKNKRTTHEILGNVRYRLTLAGVAFMVTSAAVFFVVGPPASNVATNLAGVPDSSNISAEPDFWSHPETKVRSFPLPEGGVQNSRLADDEELVPVDSMARPSEFILPNVQKVSENIDGKF